MTFEWTFTTPMETKSEKGRCKALPLDTAKFCINVKTFDKFWLVKYLATN